MKFKIKIKEGELPPKWYFGRSYVCWGSVYSVYHLVPFNYFIRWFMAARYKWDKFRTRLSWVDKQVIKTLTADNIKGLKQAYTKVNDLRQNKVDAVQRELARIVNEQGISLQAIDRVIKDDTLDEFYIDKHNNVLMSVIWYQQGNNVGFKVNSFI